MLCLGVFSLGFGEYGRFKGQFLSSFSAVQGCPCISAVSTPWNSATEKQWLQPVTGAENAGYGAGRGDGLCGGSGARANFSWTPKRPPVAYLPPKLEKMGASAAAAETGAYRAGFVFWRSHRAAHLASLRVFACGQRGSITAHPS